METDPTSDIKPHGLWRSILLATLLALAAVFVYLLITGASREFLEFGLLASLLATAGAGVYLLPLAIIIGLVIVHLHKREHLPGWLNRRSFVIFGAGLVALATLAGLHRATPAVRLRKLVGNNLPHASDVQAEGFNSFLSRRWLFSFHTTAAEVDAIAAALRLDHFEGIDLKHSLARDVFFSKRAASLQLGVPGNEASRSYARSDKHAQAGEWITLVYSEDSKRAWLYSGFQN